MSKSDLDFSLNGINVINYLILVSPLRVEENLRVAETSDLGPDE